MNKTAVNRSPILKLRNLIVGVFITAVLCLGPLLTVWKQVYINSASITIEKLTDSLSVLTTRQASLKLMCERLSNTARIESIAREQLDLEYPSSAQIVIVPLGKTSSKQFHPADPRPFFAFSGN